MRIVLVTSDLAIGGAERNVVSYGCALRRRGHDVIVVAGAGPLADELNACGVSHVVARPHLRQPWTVLGAASVLRTIHHRRRIDVVHAFMASASVAAGLARIRLQSPYALLAAPPGVAQGRDEPRWAQNLRLRLLGAGADVVLVPSPDLKERMLKVGITSSRLREVNFNAVDLRRFDVAPIERTTIGIASTDLVVCSVARLHPIKGQDLLIRAAATLRQRVPTLRVLLVGDGPARASLESLVTRLGLADTVRFIGARHDVPAILRAADVIVQTTFGTGGPGLAVLEAFAAGRPVVAFAFGDLRYAVANSDAALLVDGRDVRSLVDAIAEVLLNRDRARAMGQAGRLLVTEQYNTETVVDRLVGIYREAAGRNVQTEDTSA